MGTSVTESEQTPPVDSIKDVDRSSVKVPEFDKRLRRTYRPKRSGNNNKDEEKYPKILNDKNPWNIENIVMIIVKKNPILA